MAQYLARRAAAGLDRTRESPRNRVGTSGSSAECATRPPLWPTSVDVPDGEATRDGLHVAAPWTAERIVKKTPDPFLL